MNAINPQTPRQLLAKDQRLALPMHELMARVLRVARTRQL
jgi:hypothetical protein